MQGMLIVLMFYISAGLFAQNQPHLHLKTLKNDTLEFLLKAYMTPSDNLYGPNHGVINQFDVVNNEGNLKTYNVKYVPHPDFTGKDTVIIEYRGYPGTSIMNWKLKKVTVYIEISNSIIEVKNDISFPQLNSTGDTIDVLANDFTTDSTLLLDGIFNLRNCEASITDNNKLFVRPLSGYQGVAFLNYRATDDSGSSAIGHLMMIVGNTGQLPDTLTYYVTNTNSLSFVPGPGNFMLAGDVPVLGELDLSSSPEIIYTPFVDSLGTEIFRLVESDDTIVIVVNVIESDINSKLVIDDKVFTAGQTPVSFNVTTNDFKKNSFITSFTQPQHGSVVHSGQGNFTYTPENGFLGFDEFTYTRQLNFSQYQTATIEILVNDFLPYNDATYNINILKNKEFVLNYDIPIQGYSFEIHSQPANGNLQIFPGTDTITVNCEEITEKNLILFSPQNDFTGTTRFELRYCAPNNICNTVKVDLNILDVASDQSCYCASYQCIWEGDVDNNGIVNVKDIIPLGKYAGTSGITRSDITEQWLGLNGDNWNDDNTSAKFDLKHADSNGDGFISDLDSLNILSNYNRIHNLYFDGEIERTKFPVYITTDQTEVDSGEVLTLFINAGDEQYVAKDVTALSYILQIEPELVDSSSLHHSFYLDSWLSGTSASMQMSNHVFTGQVEAAFAKVGVKGVSGIGKIGKCDFIIEDDIIGLKRDVIRDNLLPVRIKLTNISASTGNNAEFRLPDSETTVFLRLKDRKVNSNENNITVFPNPASDKVELYLEGNEVISGFKVFNIHGKILQNTRVNGMKQTSIYTGNLMNGIYLVEVITDRNNRIVKKIEILR